MREATEFGMGFLSGEAAVFTSSTVNTKVYSRWGLYVMAGFCAPIVEELSKTGFALGSGGNILVSHMTFGSTEGFLYADESKVVRKFDHRRPLLHAAFGTLYLIGHRFGGSVSAGLFTSILGHVAWNQIALLRAKLHGVLFEETDTVLDEEKPVVDTGGFVLMSTAVEETEPEPESPTKGVSYAEIKRKLLI